MIKEIARYEKEFEDYSEVYNINSSQEPIEKEIKKVNKAVSSLENRTLNFLITEQRTNKEAFGEGGRVYKRTATISRESKIINQRELGMVEGALIQLDYHIKI
ncbi:hypothetical protein M0R72_09755 [Candidatus Pacearchaeota archaeon]|jgi:hypothetical protein|nr:hypothetical protein [Candidatus Pacearchaeota archaeon]